ncbi:hypothetical protein BDW02DRAFT_547666 [Decorospora gaudefroyi]|uniref:SRR1-like domain-containing protein n=1 Tax=Decorospora gaudefroyi TaxID=184978 RepID=A0A6A5KJ01_9PLEO|nr:hypothetical protein BDW02DRAFT_547666 [Decorospora gaudefroyi]
MGRPRIKRKQIQSEDGWTIITHGISDMRLSKQDSEKSQSKPLIPTSEMETVQGLTPKKLLVEFEKLQDRWYPTSLARQIDSLIHTKKDGICWDIETAVCIGIGSFSRDWMNRWRSLWQLVLFVRVTNLPCTHPVKAQGNSIQVHAQDPAFTPTDINFLSLLNISVTSTPTTTEPPTIHTKISPKTFLYSPFVDWYLLLPVFLSNPTHNPNPALYIGNEILPDYTPYAHTPEKRSKLHECNEIGQRWVEGRQMVRLGGFEGHGDALEGLVVYWRVGGGDGA